uniref:ATP synthase complex subunit 8 n=1 Tax=Psacothea hilaris TaxID=157325 RepID=C7ACV3_PSAHI|nr:ATP synthase F0 subunit 8 [Psacothea hilaris]ACR44356.1 ATP synthase F0 subunit 8 [Psacothea hilaris]
MPQMAPLSWLILFILFISIFFLFNIMNFYSFNYKEKSIKQKKSLLTFNWKW